MGIQNQTEKTPAATWTKKKKQSRSKNEVTSLSISSVGLAKPGRSANDFISQYVPRKFLLAKSGGNWFLNEFTDPTVFVPADDILVQQLRDYAAQIWEDDTKLFKSTNDSRKSSDMVWMKKVISSGTLSDKVAGLTVLIQDDAVHNISCLETLTSMVTTKAKRECLMALGALEGLFLNDLLPDNRKLKTFKQHPLGNIEEISSGNKDSRDRRLLMWLFEDRLKDVYSKFVKSLGEVSHDNLPASKKKAISIVFQLLVNKPEQEKMLLTILINKLGDPDYKIASKVAYYLTKLVENHPRMKQVITLEVEQILYRTNISSKAQYYAICFLNQLILSHDECDLASRLMGIYFSFFKSCVRKGDVDSKMMSALLCGVNRAYPFAKDKEKMSEQLNMLYKVVHIVNFNTSIQALMLIYQVMDTSENLSDRYFVALFRKLLDPDLKHCSKQAMFLNLLFKSLLKDTAEKRVKAFVKRLLQVCKCQSASFVCGALILLDQVLKDKPGLLNLSTMSEYANDEEKFHDLIEESDVDSTQESQLKPLNGEDGTDVSDVWQSATGCWLHKGNSADKSINHSYDPHLRNPLYCRAELECIWELKELTGHFHPSVALFAQNLLTGKTLQYLGDPLQDFTLIHFLDRFVYRNPKKKDDEAPRGIRSKCKQYTPMGVRAIPVNSEKYLEIPEDNIPTDEKFFYRYFKQQSAGKRKADTDSDMESVDDEEFDEFLDEYEAKHGGDNDDVECDFAGDFDSKKMVEVNSEDENEESIDENMSDEEVDFGDELDEEFGSDIEAAEDDESGQWNEEEVEFSEDDMSEVDFTEHGNNKKRKSKLDDGLPVAAKRRKKDDNSNVFAAAEEFSHLIDETNEGGLDVTGSESLSNIKDKAGVKQLKWEIKREKSLKNDSSSRRHSKGRKPPRRFGKASRRGRRR